MLAFIIAALASLPTAAPPADWLHVETVRATGFEKIMGGHEHSFSVMRDSRRFCFELRRGIDGQLGESLRTEIASADGIYTWLPSDPRFALQLPLVTAPEIAETVLPVRFKRDDLSGRSEELQRSIGKDVKKEGEGAIASRDCMVLSLTDQSALTQSLWVDSQTGIALRQVDQVGKDDVYERLLTSVDVNETLPDASFQLPTDTIVLRGIVSPSILISALKPRSATQYDVDLNMIQKTSVIEGGSWIKRYAPSSNYQYAGTARSESAGTTYQSDSGEHVSQPTSNVYRPQFGGIPSGWTVPGQVVLNGGMIYFGFTDKSDGTPRQLPSQISGMAAIGQSADTNAAVSFSGYVTADGSIYMPPPPPASADPSKQPSTTAATDIKAVAPAAPDATALVKSDFFDPSTGDTVTFAQMRNLALISQFKGFKLPIPTTLVSERYPAMFSYSIQSPFALNVVEWRVGPTDYLLAATKISLRDLQKMAEKIP